MSVAAGFRIAESPEEPEGALDIDPGYSPGSCPRDVGRSGYTFCSVCARLVYGMASGYPRPSCSCRIIAPEVIEPAPVANRIISVSPEEPESARGVEPG